LKRISEFTVGSFLVRVGFQQEFTDNFIVKFEFVIVMPIILLRGNVF